MTRIIDYKRILPILEIYPCLQGEGGRIGRPVIAIRTTGCTHRCHFGEGGWCDTWYSSIHAEQGRLCFQDIIDCHQRHPLIKELMITGGAPTMHPNLLNELSHYAEQQQLFTTLETEGSHFVRTDYPLDLISLSPKFSNTIPKLSYTTPLGKAVTPIMIEQHNKYRLNHTAISDMLAYHKDYQFKPVWNGCADTLKEIKDFIKQHQLSPEKTYVMPAGETRAQLIKMYPIVMAMCLKEGFNFSARSHIMAFDDERGV